MTHNYFEEIIYVYIFNAFKKVWHSQRGEGNRTHEHTCKKNNNNNN